jgi:magnesium transporter
MICLYAIAADGLKLIESGPEPGANMEKATWIDLKSPTPEEENAVERTLGLDVPTREEMREIEESSRIYEATGALFMTGVIITGIAENRPARTEVSFVLTPKHLVTVRYSDPLPFKTFEQKCARKPEEHSTASLLFISLIEQIVQRIADVLEKIATEIDGVAGDVFNEEGAAAGKDTQYAPRVDLQRVVNRLGRSSALLGKLRESLLSFNRILSFVRRSAETWLEEMKPKAKSLERDIASLTEYAEHLAAQIGHLQEATFNLINIEQNRVIKVFSIAAVLFLPPTLVATLYGMNFEYMPELNWTLGYPFSIVLMIVSALLPYYWFKRNNWL